MRRITPAVLLVTWSPPSSPRVQNRRTNWTARRSPGQEAGGLAPPTVAVWGDPSTPKWPRVICPRNPSNPRNPGAPGGTGGVLEAAATSAPMDAPEDTDPDVAVAGPPARTPDIHFVPTPQDVVDQMLELAKVTKDDLVYDLGCGDGRIVVTAAKKYGCKAVGYDIDPQRVKESLDDIRIRSRRW